MQGFTNIAEIQRMGNRLLLPHCQLANHDRVKSKRSNRDQSSPWILVTVLARTGAHFSRCGAGKILPQAQNAFDTAVNWGLSCGWPVALLFIQQEVHAWHIPIVIKFLATLATTTAIGFASYALFVRHILIGTLLNRPRKNQSGVNGLSSTENLRAGSTNP